MIKVSILVLQVLAILYGLFPNVVRASNLPYEVPDLIKLPDKTLRVQYIQLPPNYATTDDGTGSTACPDGYTFPKPSSYLELIALKANIPDWSIHGDHREFPLGISAIMSSDGTQLLSVDSNTGRIISRTFWDNDLISKMFKMEIPPTYSQLILDLTDLPNLIDSNSYIEGKALHLWYYLIVCH